MPAEETIPPKSACPAAHELTDFTRGRLPPERLETLAEHLAHCPRCESSLHDVPDTDALERQLRRPPRRPALLDEPTCAQLEQRACAIPQDPNATPTVSENRAAQRHDGPPLPVDFGGYRLLAVLGQGGMGIVYQARQEAIKRLVALKLVRAGVYASAEERARFQREGEVIARLQHPHVVQIYELGEDRGQLYFSMELLEGGTLAERLKSRVLAEREAAELVRTLAQTVAAAHRQGVVHRDLKPSNVMFAADGTVKITDFGLAKLLDDSSSNTCSEAILGTPAYMAPEQARGESRKIGPATDVYALGAILYELLAGRPPFQGENRSHTLALARDQEPESPSRHRPRLARDLEAICLKCLEKDSGQRYASAAVLADDLDRWLRSEATTARPRGLLARLGRHARRHPRAVAAVALLVLAALAVPAGLWYRDPERSRRAIENELSQGRPQTLIGATQGPRWSRWRAGQETSQVSVLADGTFVLGSFQSALLELMPDPQRPHYRFRALVRQEKGFRQAEMGLYVAHHAHALPAGVVHQFVALAFYDIERDIDLWANVVAKPLPVKPPPPQGNAAMLDPHLYAERSPTPWEPRVHVGPRAFFEPAGVGGKDWRELAVEVTPQGIKGFWDGKAMGVLAQAQVVQSINDYLTDLQASQPKEPLAQGCESVYEPRGGLGLYVHNGSASFRRVVIEPLD